MEINICNQETFVDFDKHQEYNVHSTKRCPECKNDKLLLLTSQNLKLCGNTGMHKDGKIKRIPWNLDEGQKPIF